MKQRKKVWVVLGLQGGLWGLYLSRTAAQGEADLWGSYGRSLKVIPAIVEYEVIEKVKKP
jgi:hypothetical protein